MEDTRAFSSEGLREIIEQTERKEGKRGRPG